jgi:hypothetical protein
MSYEFVVFPDPLEAVVVLTLDAGAALAGVPYVDANGRPGQVCTVYDGAPNGHGAALEVSAPGYVPLKLRGVLWLNDGDKSARLQVDDYDLQVQGSTPGPDVPPINPDRSPADIIQGVYESTRADLSTHEGCGKFTEDCCTALHNEHSNAWGHIAKEPAQNQYNGHAVDAVMLLGATPDDTAPGIYDIIQDSVSANATPAFNYKEGPNYELWYYPAAVYRIGVTRAGRPVLRKVP